MSPGLSSQSYIINANYYTSSSFFEDHIRKEDNFLTKILYVNYSKATTVYQTTVYQGQ